MNSFLKIVMISLPVAMLAIAGYGLLQRWETNDWASYFQGAAVAAAVQIYLVSNVDSSRRENEIANRELYQRFEFASIDIFRFEAQHVELIGPLWVKDAELPKEGSADRIAFMNYVCQMMNLFEMGVYFRKRAIVPADIFGSWVAWFFSVSQAPGFPAIWKAIENDYIGELSQIMRAGFILNVWETGASAIERRGLFEGLQQLSRQNRARARKWFRWRAGPGLFPRRLETPVTREELPHKWHEIPDLSLHHDGSLKAKVFYHCVGELFDCNTVRNWLQRERNEIWAAS